MHESYILSSNGLPFFSGLASMAYAVAKFDFVAENEKELSFYAGDVIKIVKQTDTGSFTER